MVDRYRCFAELASGERLGADYQIVISHRHSVFAAIAPHGGWIEPGTSELAAAIAANEHSFYAFEGLRRGRAHGDLHITSVRFDEPQGLTLVAGCHSVIAVHGRVNSKDPSTWLGGLHEALRRAIAAALEKAGFEVRLTVGVLAATDAANICNRTADGAGVQLELPRTLRDRLVGDDKLMAAYSGAIRSCLLPDSPLR